MNYIVDGKIYTANEGYIFQSKTTGILSKTLRLRKPEMLDNYKIIVEPQEIEEMEGNEND